MCQPRIEAHVAVVSVDDFTLDSIWRQLSLKLQLMKTNKALSWILDNGIMVSESKYAHLLFCSPPGNVVKQQSDQIYGGAAPPPPHEPNVLTGQRQRNYSRLCNPTLNASEFLHGHFDKAWLHCRSDPAPPDSLLLVIKVYLPKQKTVRAFHYIGIAKEGKSQITYGWETVLLRQ